MNNEDKPVISREHLTKREIFAAMAMQGIMANLGQCHGLHPDDFGMSKLAVDCADALLAALETN